MRRRKEGLARSRLAPQCIISEFQSITRSHETSPHYESQRIGTEIIRRLLKTLSSGSDFFFLLSMAASLYLIRH